MSVVGIVRCLPLGRSKDCCRVSINYRSVYGDTLDIVQNNEQALAVYKMRQESMANIRGHGRDQP